MTKTDWVVAALLRLYPAAWRRNYGEELTAILLGRPLTARVIADVVWNGLWQRGRAAEPSTILGLASMVVLLAGLVVSGGRNGGDAWTVLRPSSTTLPTVMVTGLLLAFGFLDVVSLDAHGAAKIRPFAWAVLAAPLARVPEAWVWGSVGGFVGKHIARRRPRTATPP